MKSFLSMAFAVALAFAGATAARAGEAAPPPPDQGPIYVTTYFEVAPPNGAQALANLKEYRGAARGEPGVMKSDILQEAGMPSRFVTNEIWKDWAAYDAHLMAPARSRLMGQMSAILWGPPDTRTHLAHAAVEGQGAPANGVVILSHLDVTPNFIPRLLEMMAPLVEGSTKDPGMERYQILRQAPGTGNHFRVYEVWANEKDWEAHNAQAHTKKFRDDLVRFLGTPYDQRRYNIVN